MATVTYSDLFNDAAKWAEPDPAYINDLIPLIGETNAVNRTDWARNVCNIAIRSPTAVLFVNGNDADHLYVAHSPTMYPANPGNATPFDNLMILLQGNTSDGVLPLCFPAASGVRINDTRCKRIAAITADLGAAPPVLMTGPHGAGVADTDQVSVRTMMVLPPSVAGTVLAAAPQGRFTRVGFLTNVLAPGLADPDAAVAAMWAPVEDWFRVTSTEGGAPAACVTAVTPVASVVPLEIMALTAWSNTVKERLQTQAGLGGPGLTNHTFNVGVNNLTNTMNQNATARLQFERDRNDKSFTQRHGDSLAQRMHRLTGAADDAGLPEAHKLLAKAPRKSADYALLGSLFRERAEASTVPLSATNAPLATTKLVTEVFRDFCPAGTGLVFAQGLSPFAIVCEGHAEAHAASRLIHRAATVESGTAISLQDAETITTNEAKFPPSAYFAGEKLYGWSVVIDVFHGTNHAISTNVRSFALNVVPSLHHLEIQMADTPRAGLDLVCRVLYECQQEYFHWARRVAAQGPAGIPVPTFDSILDKVVTYRPNSLNQLPQPWYRLVDAPQRAGTSPQAPSQNSNPRSESGSATVVNAYADRHLMQRFAACSHTTINALLGGRGADIIPKYKNQAVCLTWALKGECTSGCRRRHQHVRYPRTVNQAIDSMLDVCGIADPEP